MRITHLYAPTTTNVQSGQDVGYFVLRHRQFGGGIGSLNPNVKGPETLRIGWLRMMDGI